MVLPEGIERHDEETVISTMCFEYVVPGSDIDVRGTGTFWCPAHKPLFVEFVDEEWSTGNQDDETGNGTR